MNGGFRAPSGGGTGRHIGKNMAVATVRTISQATIIGVLKKIPLFFGLDDHECEQLITACQVVRYPRGATIFAEGEPGKEMFVLLAGQVEIRSTGNGVLHTVYPGEIFGEIALITPLGRTGSATASKDATLMRIGAADIDQLLARAPRLSYQVMRHIGEVLAARLANANRRLAEAQRERLAGRAG